MNYTADSPYRDRGTTIGISLFRTGPSPSFQETCSERGLLTVGLDVEHISALFILDPDFSRDDKPWEPNDPTPEDIYTPAHN